MGWFRGTRTDDDEPVPSSYEERLAAVGPGIPGHCPACDGLGYIESIDIGHRYQIQHCKDCLHRWEYLFDGDGRVVGVTRLDEAGQPVTRSRIRVAPLEEQDEAPAVEPRIALPKDHSGDVLDLRDTPGLDLTEPEKLSPADWLRQSRRG